MNAFGIPTHGNKSTDYYYTTDKCGRKSYYSRITERKISKRDIDPKYQNDVKEFTESPLEKASKLIDKRNNLLISLSKLKNKHVVTLNALDSINSEMIRFKIDTSDKINNVEHISKK